MKNQTITISVLIFGGSVKKMQARDGITVREVMAELSAPETIYTCILINGKRQTLDTILKDADLLVLVFPIRGEATVRRNGNAWRIHANDQDDIFPSDFHAHNIETGEILDLRTGLLYNPRTRQPLAALHRKDFFAILSKLKESKEQSISSKSKSVIG